ncbi:sialin-like [Mercenaria mercenaria]|uniref:sialin-like n=1 Tax=Mercenaria mercenaria TaxID=6596 RepID=UPI00234EC7FE|nr:sialin-like [Mercenaria mercenaria]
MFNLNSTGIKHKYHFFYFCELLWCSLLGSTRRLPCTSFWRKTCDQCLLDFISDVLDSVPGCSFIKYAFIFIIRIVLGFSGGLFTPSMYSLMMYWTIPTERASVLSCSLSGQPSGIVLAYVTSGFLCSFGWPVIFYVHGGVTLVFMLLWLYEIRNTPGQHPRISQAEKEYLTSCTTNKSKKSVPPTPWKSILLSKPQWAVTLVHFVFNWSLFTVVINIPLFLKEAFAYIISENGVFSAMPYVFSAITWMFSGTISAVVIRKRLLSVQATRKTMTAIRSTRRMTKCILPCGRTKCFWRNSVLYLRRSNS